MSVGGYLRGLGRTYNFLNPITAFISDEKCRILESDAYFQLQELIYSRIYISLYSLQPNQN